MSSGRCACCGDLEESWRFYGRAAARGVEHDYGYTAINASFTLDVLAELERPVIEIIDGRTRTRTLDPLIRSQLVYR
jgi:hypothetical protein